MPTPAIYPHTAALQALLATAGYPTEFNRAPAETSPPYFVLYSLPSTAVDGTLADPDADWQLLYQVTCVAPGPEQAQDLADLAVATLQGSTLTVSGRTIWRVDCTELGQIDRDDETVPPLHYGVVTVRVATTPA